jgi:hypothetical protein
MGQGQNQQKHQSPQSSVLNLSSGIRFHFKPPTPQVAPVPVRPLIPANPDPRLRVSVDERRQVAAAIMAMRNLVDQQNAALVRAIDTLSTAVFNVIS